MSARKMSLGNLRSKSDLKQGERRDVNKKREIRVLLKKRENGP